MYLQNTEQSQILVIIIIRIVILISTIVAECFPQIIVYNMHETVI